MVLQRMTDRWLLEQFKMTFRLVSSNYPLLALHVHALPLVENS